MAEVKAVWSEPSKFRGSEFTKVTWSGLTNGDSGEPIPAGLLAEKSIQVTGTFGTGGTVVIEGSNDGNNWFAMPDPQGNALSFTASGLKRVDMNTEYIRPRVSAGDATTSVTVIMCAKSRCSC